MLESFAIAIVELLGVLFLRELGGLLKGPVSCWSAPSMSAVLRCRT